MTSDRQARTRLRPRLRLLLATGLACASLPAQARDGLDLAATYTADVGATISRRSRRRYVSVPRTRPCRGDIPPFVSVAPH